MPQIFGRRGGPGAVAADHSRPLTLEAIDTLALSDVRPFSAHRPHHVRAANVRLVAMTGLARLVLLPLPYSDGADGQD
jgi:hypothetical protein